MKLLFIGKNSSVFRAIEKHFKTDYDYSAISHTEIGLVDVSAFDRIIVLSLAPTFEDNALLLNRFIGAEVLYLSSIASIVSEDTGKQINYSSYPRLKFQVEQHALMLGFMVIRFSQLDALETKFPVLTDSSVLAKKIFGCDYKRGTFYCVQLKRKTSINIMDTIYYDNRHKYFAILFVLFYRCLNKKFYGYTKLASSYFAPSIIVGNGLFASKYLDKVADKGSCLIITSNEQNTELKCNGFAGTLIAQESGGLGRYWHGVRIIEKFGKLYKYVPIWPYRPKYKADLNNRVTKINYDDISNLWVLKLDKVSQSYFCDTLILAAGWSANSTLLASFSGVDELSYSDHEIANIGAVQAKELFSRGFLNKIGPFVIGREVISMKSSVHDFLVDFRPATNKQTAHFYRDTTRNILQKLFKEGSLSRLNQAVFNKFGIALQKSKFEVYVQIVAQDAVKFKDNVLSRRRISPNVWKEVASAIEAQFSSFVATENVQSVDAQHLLGAGELLNNARVERHVSEGNLVILGSPTDYQLSSRHHSCDLFQYQQVRRSKKFTD